MTAYPTVFDLIADLAQKAGVRLILIGGFAVNAYGVARTTQDVDFLIRDEDYSAFHEAFEKQGFHEVFRNNLFARFEHSTRSEMPVDILFLDDATFDSVWKGGKTVSLHGCSFATPSLDHLIALKLHAVKQGGERREWKDLDDILNLVSENKFDDAKLKKLCLKFGPPGVYEMLL
jgi:predicted nucleotidyltransferase